MMKLAFKGHNDVVNCFATHSRRLFSGSDDETVRVFDMQTVSWQKPTVSMEMLTVAFQGNCVDVLSGHSAPVSSLVIEKSQRL